MMKELAISDFGHTPKFIKISKHLEYEWDDKSFMIGIYRVS